MLRAILVCLALVGCADDSKPAAAPETPAPAVEPAGAEPAPAAVEPEPAAAPADAGDCVAACVQRNQMRAVAPGQIEADCKAECAE